MSLHLTLCALELVVDDRSFTARHKLALIAFADSGSEDGRISKPGLDAIMRCASVKRSRALEISKDLVELGLIARYKTAHRGRRAEYIVFPKGCCAKHGPVVIDGVVYGELTPVPAAGNGSAVPDPFAGHAQTALGPAQERTQSAVHSVRSTADPIAGNGSAADGVMGPPQPPEWVHGTRSIVDRSVKAPTQPTPPSGDETGLVTSRETDVDDPNLDFTVVDLVQPDRLVAGPCGECENGWLIGADGIPIGKCPQCHPGYQRQPGATA